MIPIQAVELAKEIGDRWRDATAILYGSFARGKFDERSDVDLLIVGRVEEDRARQLADEVLRGLEKRGEKTWSFSLIFVGSIDEVDPSLKATIATEGITLLGRPGVSAEGLEPHVIFQYDVSKLSSTERKRFYRALNSTGLSRFKWGSTLLVPASDAGEAEDLLSSHRVVKRRARVLVKT